MKAAEEALDELGDGLGFDLMSAGVGFSKISRSQHPSWSHLGRKVEPDRSKMPSRRGLDNQIWQVSAVLL